MFPRIYAGQTSEVHYYMPVMTLMLTEMDSTPVFLFLVLHLIHYKISNDRTQGVPPCLFCDECQGLRNVLPGSAHQ